MLEKLTFLSWKEGSTTWKLADLIRTLYANLGGGMDVAARTDSSGGLDLIRQIARGNFDLLATYPHAAKWAIEGRFAYAGESLPNLRAVALVDRPSWVMVAFAKETGIQNMQQIRERKQSLRLIITGKDSLTGEIDRACLFEHGFSEQDITSRRWRIFELFKDFDQPQIGPYLRDDKADGIVTYGEPLLRFWQEASVWRDLNYLSLEPDVIDRVSVRYGVRPGTVQSGTFRGQREDVRTVVYPGWVILCRADLKSETTYNLAKQLDLNSEALISSAGRFSFNGNRAWRDTGVQLHEGAARYYGERGYFG